jgi:hypothetical protein
MRRIRHHLTYANVMATFAVFVVLGGGAYAAFRLPKNSVRSRNIKNGEVKSPDVKDNGLTGTDIKEATLGKVPRAAQADTAGDAYIDRVDAIQALNNSGATEVASLSLPPGSYVLVAKLLADNDNASAARIDCNLDDPQSNHLDFMKLRLQPTNISNLEFGNISLAGAVTLGASGTVSVQCTQLEDSPPPGITVGFRKLVAIKIDNLHS